MWRAAPWLRMWASVLYNVPGPAVWHQRYLIGRVVSLGSEPSAKDTWMVATPDADIYEEDLGGTSVDMQAVRYAAVRRPPPPGLPRGSCYRFAVAPGAAQRQGWRAAAEEVALEVRQAAAARAGVVLRGNGRSLAPVDEAPDDLEGLLDEGRLGRGAAAEERATEGGRGDHLGLDGEPRRRPPRRGCGRVLAGGGSGRPRASG